MADPFLDALSAVRRPAESADADDAFLAALSDVRAANGAADDPSLAQQVVRMGVRVVPSIVGAISGGVLGAPAGPAGVLAGGMAGGAFGAGLGELGAEYLESRPGAGHVRERINPVQVATQTALGAIPIPGVRPGVGVLRAAIGQGAKGAVLGGTAAVATHLAEGQTPTPSSVAQAAGLGAVLGGSVGAVARPRGGAPAVSPPRGYLRAGPSYVAGERGPAVPFGDAIPMQRAPDGSFVRAVPGEYARREVKGLLPAGPRFVAGEHGPAVPLAQATEQADAFAAALDDLRASESSVRSVPAAPLAYEFEGRALRPTQFSSDVQATAAPHVDLSSDEARELRRMAAEMEALPFTPHTFHDAGTGRGGELAIVPGAAGAEVYQDIVGDASRASRTDVSKAIANVLAGKRTPVGDLALDVARRRLAGDRTVSRPLLPPEAGDLPTPRRGEGEEAGIERLDALQRAIHGDEYAPRGNGTFSGAAEEGFDRFAADVDDLAHRGGPREPGEFGLIRPEMAIRLGAGAAGGAVGAIAPGEDTSLEGRLLGAATGAGLGFAAGRLIKPRGGVLRTGRAPVTGGMLRTLSQAPEARTAVPPAGQIPANRLHTMPTLTEDVQDAAEDLLERYGGFVRQRRGVQSVARTEVLADRVDVRTDRPVAPGTAANAERLRAYQNATATILHKRQQMERTVQQLDEAVRQNRASEAQRLDLPARQLELERLKTESEVLTKSLRGMTAEAGRALHILRYQARILQSGDQEAIQQAAQASRRGLNETAQSYFYANILSGIQTHERNVLGNLSNAIYNLAAHPLAVGADVVRSAVTGQTRHVFLGELPERVAGTVVALPRAFSNALRALKTGIPAADVTTFDRPAIREFRGGGANPFNYPKRALESVDDFFSTIAAEQTRYGAAFAQAKREGLSGEALIRRVADLKVNPSDDIRREVESQRARLLFRERPGAIAEGVLAFKRRLPALGYVAPFVKIPANIIRQGFEASPAGFAMKGARQGGRAGADAMGRAAMGSLALAPLAYYAALGKITGDAPRDPAKRAAFYESGRRAHAVQFGDTWYSYQPIQPLNVPLSLVANTFQVWSEAKGNPDANAEDLALSVLGRMGSSLLDQSFLSGVSALVDALGDPERYFQRFAQQVATGFVPFSSAMRMTAQATDPYIRAPKGVVQGVQAIIPGASQALPPRLTRFGEPVERVEGALNVFKPSRVVKDPVAEAMSAADVDIRPAQGPTQVNLGRLIPPFPLQQRQRVAVGQASGRAVRQILERLTATPQFQQASPAVQQMLMERAIAAARGGVNEQLRREALLQQMAGQGR